MKKLLILQAAALGFDFAKSHGVDSIAGLDMKPAETLFPALTCPVQAMFRTGLPPSENDLFFNGFYHHDLMRPFFWEQSHKLVKGRRVWEKFQTAGGKTAMLFWQQSLGESVDFLLSPAPVHTHGGGLIDAVYSLPAGLYDQICRSTGNRFRLHSYWGPLAGLKSSTFITDATCSLLQRHDAPDLVFSYIPHLDYSLQKYGPKHAKSAKALSKTLDLIDRLADCAKENGYEFLAFGDYAIGEACKVLYPNRVLHETGLFRTRQVKGRLYPDYCSSAAFAVTDHEVAFVYLNDRDAGDNCLKALNAIAPGLTILDRTSMRQMELASDSGPDFIITGKPGTWFSYRWWERDSDAPDFATHVDIHNKPGFDPCELFFGWHPFIISTNDSRVKGTHGHNSPGREIAWFSSLDIQAETLRELALHLKNFLHGEP